MSMLTRQVAAVRRCFQEAREAVQKGKPDRVARRLNEALDRMDAAGQALQRLAVRRPLKSGAAS